MAAWPRAPCSQDTLLGPVHPARALHSVSPAKRRRETGSHGEDRASVLADSLEVIVYLVLLLPIAVNGCASTRAFQRPVRLLIVNAIVSSFTTKDALSCASPADG